MCGPALAAAVSFLLFDGVQQDWCVFVAERVLGIIKLQTLCCNVHNRQWNHVPKGCNARLSIRRDLSFFFLLFLLFVPSFVSLVCVFV